MLVWYLLYLLLCDKVSLGKHMLTLCDSTNNSVHRHDKKTCGTWKMIIEHLNLYQFSDKHFALCTI